MKRESLALNQQLSISDVQHWSLGLVSCSPHFLFLLQGHHVLLLWNDNFEVRNLRPLRSGFSHVWIVVSHCLLVLNCRFLRDALPLCLVSSSTLHVFFWAMSALSVAIRTLKHHWVVLLFVLIDIWQVQVVFVFVQLSLRFAEFLCV